MNEWARGTLDDVENLTEVRLDEVLKEFMKDFRENSLETKGWHAFLSAYMLSDKMEMFLIGICLLSLGI